jgi:hypothetical protein
MDLSSEMGSVLPFPNAILKVASIVARSFLICIGTTAYLSAYFSSHS